MLIDLFCTEKRGLLQQVIIEYYQNSLYYYYWIEEKYITLIVVRIKYVMEAETTWEAVNHSAMRHIPQLPFTCHFAPIFKELNILTNTQQDSQFMLKIAFYLVY